MAVRRLVQSIGCTRRAWLRSTIGRAGVASLAGILGSGHLRWLENADASERNAADAPVATSRADALIILFLNGGPSHLNCGI